MTTLAFDGETGASGDMLLAALVAVGADPAVLEPVEAALDVSYAIGETNERGIRATNVDVLVEYEEATGGDGADADAGGGRGTADEGDRPDSDDHAHDRPHQHEHDDHSHGHDHDRAHPHHQDQAHSHAHASAEGAGPHRTYPEVVEVVESMGLSASVVADALSIFEILGEAEASVHGTDLAETHFHEVGADDAIADVIGVALLVADLDVDRIVTTPLSTGGGTVEMSHGTYPVPGPAVVAIAAQAEWSIRGGPVDRELLTPTGAAILAHYAEGVASVPPIRVERVGYGAGDADLEDRPNVLRAIVGEAQGRLRRDEITVLETNVDDVTPEVLGGLHESLAAVGARDVSIVPTTMKKSRSGHLVQVICKPGDVERVARRLARETGTLGVRETGASHRWIADRCFETVEIEVGGDDYEVAVKVATDVAGTVYDVSAEYDDAAAVARATGLAVREVIRRAETVFTDRG